MTGNRFGRAGTVAMALWMALLAAVVFGGASGAEAGNKRLSQPCTYTVGDDIARRMASMFRISGGLEPATMVSYDRKTHTLVAEILGSAENVQAAKGEILGFLQVIREGVAPYAKKHHGITLSDTDVTLIFFINTGEEPPYEIVRREAGVFVEPKPETGD